MTGFSILPVKEQGFTLLELLISLAAAILLIAALTEILISIKEGWAKTSDIERQWSDEIFTEQLFSRILSASFPPEQTNQTIHFKGLENSIEFTSIPSESAFRLGHMNGRLFLTPSKNGLFALQLSLDPPTMAKNNQYLKGQNWTLLNGVKIIEFFYFSGDLDQGSRLWVNRNKLPEVIKLRIVFADESRQPIWVIARPHQTVTSNCLIDLTSFVCREPG